MPARTDNPAGTGATASKTIGASGGSLTLEGVTLTIPAGALSEDTEISITSNTQPMSTNYAAYSPVYDFFPNGLAFATPATVKLAPTVAGATKLVMFWTKPGDLTTFEALASPEANGVVSAQVTHFSSGFLGEAGTGDGGAGGPLPPGGGMTGATGGGSGENDSGVTGGGSGGGGVTGGGTGGGGNVGGGLGGGGGALTGGGGNVGGGLGGGGGALTGGGNMGGGLGGGGGTVTGGGSP